MLEDAEQEAVRQNLIKYLESTGVKARVIAERIDVPPSVLSSFKHGKKNLYKDTLFMLNNYLKFANFDTVSCTININKTFLG